MFILIYFFFISDEM